MPEFFANWTVQMRKGLLEYCILKSLVQTDRYGYDLARSLASLPGLDTTEGTVYPLLSRLRRNGLLDTRLIESRTGPARKYYSITSRGRTQIALMDAYYQTIQEALLQAERKGENR